VTLGAIPRRQHATRPGGRPTNPPGTAIIVGPDPDAIAVTPDGSTVYVANHGFGVGTTVTPIATATNTPGTPITVGRDPNGIAITPDGTTAYVANATDGTVTPIATATNTRARRFPSEIPPKGSPSARTDRRPTLSMS